MTLVSSSSLAWVHHLVMLFTRQQSIILLCVSESEPLLQLMHVLTYAPHFTPNLGTIICFCSRSDSAWHLLGPYAHAVFCEHLLGDGMQYGKEDALCLKIIEQVSASQQPSATSELTALVFRPTVPVRTSSTQHHPLQPQLQLQLQLLLVLPLFSLMHQPDSKSLMLLA